MLCYLLFQPVVYRYCSKCTVIIQSYMDPHALIKLGIIKNKQNDTNTKNDAGNRTPQIL